MPDTSRDPIQQAAETAARNQTMQIAGERRGDVSVFVCPECGGILWQVDEPKLIYFRCHVGHTIAGEALLMQQAQAAENSLWQTIRTLTDSVVLARQLAREAEKQSDQEAAARFAQQAQAAGQQADTLRGIAEDVQEHDLVSGAGRTDK